MVDPAGLGIRYGCIDALADIFVVDGPKIETVQPGQGQSAADIVRQSRINPEEQEARLNLQLQAHKERDNNQSILGSVVGLVYDGDKQSKSALQQLADDMQKAKREGNTEQYRADALKVDQMLKDDKDSLWTADTVTGVGTGALKAGGLFMAIAATRGKVMAAAGASTFALYGLDQAKANDSFGNQAFDFTLGGTKGIATAGTFKALSTVEMNPLARGVAFGTTSRFIDLGLTKETYNNPATGNKFDVAAGLERTLSGTFATKSMITDAALFGISSKLSSTVGKIAGPELAASPMFRTVSTSSMFGLSSGMHAEFVRQDNAGESLDIGRVITRGLLQATADGFAGVPAGRYSSSLMQPKVETTPRVVPETVKSLAPVAPELVRPVAPEAPAKVAPAEVIEAPPAVRGGKASDITLADGTRIIEKPNGTRVTIHTNGDRVMEEPGAPKITFKPDGRVQREGPDGKIIETRSKANTPLDERPLNVASGAYEAIGKQLSNFARRPFELDGKRYESVEAFYQGLKWSDPVQRAEIAKLYGPQAKSAGRGSKATEFEYNGQTIQFKSPEHYALMKRAITASLEQNPAILREFQATEPRPIEHKTGRRENPNSGYPNSVFTATLLEIRAETLAKATPGPVEMNNKTSNPVPVSDLLRSIKGNDVGSNHNVTLYAEAFKDSHFQASSVVASGGDALVLKLADGNILKLTSRTQTRPSEPFDMPVLESGVKAVDGRQVRYTVQPEAQPANIGHLSDFLRTLSDHGFRMSDPGVSQIGIHDGQVKLLDPYAVTRN